MALLSNIFKQKSYQTQLEEYIVSKNPETTADVENFTREFERKLIEQSLSNGNYYR